MTARIEVSLALRNCDDDPGDWSWFLDSAAAAEEADFDRIVVSDHVVMREHLDEYSDPPVGGRSGRKQPTGTPAHLAGGANHPVSLAHKIVIAPLRNAVILAKTAATLDVLSRGAPRPRGSLGYQPYDEAAALHEAPATVIEAGATDVLVAARIPLGQTAATNYLQELRGQLGV